MPVVLREVFGEILRDVRHARGMTLREVASTALLSLGYLSEIERGQKEASSEMLAAVCGALDISQAQLLMMASRVCAAREDESSSDRIAA